MLLMVEKQALQEREDCFLLAPWLQFLLLCSCPLAQWTCWMNFPWERLWADQEVLLPSFGVGFGCRKVFLGEEESRDGEGGWHDRNHMDNAWGRRNGKEVGPLHHDKAGDSPSKGQEDRAGDRQDDSWEAVDEEEGEGGRGHSCGNVDSPNSDSKVP